MNVLGIDVSTNSCGIAVVNSERKLIWSKSLKLNKFKKHRDRRKYLVRVVNEIGRRFGYEFILVEFIRPVVGNQLFVAPLVRLNSLVFALVDGQDKPVKQVQVRVWRKYVLGTAKADKLAAIEHVRAFYGKEPKTHDEAEAICIAEFGAMCSHRFDLKEVD